MDSDKSILEFVGNRNGLLALNRLLKSAGFLSSLSEDFKLSENDTIRLNNILKSESAKEYCDAWVNLKNAENKLRKISGFVHYNYAKANLNTMTNLEKRYIYDSLSLRYKDKLLSLCFLDELEYSDDNIKILIDIHLLKSCFYNRESRELLCSYDDWKDYLVEDNETEMNYVYNVDYDTIDVIAKKYIFEDIVERNREAITRNGIIPNLDYSENNFRTLFEIDKYFMDFYEYIEEVAYYRRPAPDYETMVMSALINGEGDLIGY